MLRATVTLVAISAMLILASVPASARDCGAWDASMQELEEGRALVASVCTNDDGGRSYLEVRCFQSGLNVRFVPFVEGGFSGFSRDLMFETDAAKRPVFVSYEGLDGAFAAYLPLGHTAVEMMKSGKTVTVSDPQGKVPSRNFALGNSRQAIEKLEKSCER